jgi:FKBP-type peptidyl-prolyl cis-trans isomerase FkpA
MAGCTPTYKKAADGSEYKLVLKGSTEKIKYGSFIQFHLKQFYKDNKTDTLLGDTRDYMPRIAHFDSTLFPEEYLDIITKMGKGDSIFIRKPVDSIYKGNTHLMPAYMNHSGVRYTAIKILDVFKNRRQADSVDRVEFKRNSLKIYENQLSIFENEIEKNRHQIEEDSKAIRSFLDGKKVKYTRGKWGTFIVVHDQGKGEKINYNNVVAFNYTAKTFNEGRIYYSTTDPKFKSMGPYEITMSKPGTAMAGLTDALMQLNNGAKATIYIPSSLAYGTKGFKTDVKPNESVIFDIEVIKMITEIEAMEIVSDNNQRADRENQRINDSLKIFKPFQ